MLFTNMRDPRNSSWRTQNLLDTHYHLPTSAGINTFQPPRWMKRAGTSRSEIFNSRTSSLRRNSSSEKADVVVLTQPKSKLNEELLMETERILANTSKGSRECNFSNGSGSSVTYRQMESQASERVSPKITQGISYAKETLAQIVSKRHDVGYFILHR